MKDKFKEFAAEVVLKTSKYLRDNLGKVKEIGHKEEIINLVTNVDRKTEKIIISTLRKYFPDDGFLSEEFGEKNGNSSRKWIIDPLDGTTNYTHGFPFYAISIAVLEGLRPIFGLVFDPERNELFTAIESKGAYCNEEKIKVSKISNLNESLLATGFSYKIREAKDDNTGHFKAFFKGLAGYSAGRQRQPRPLLCGLWSF